MGVIPEITCRRCGCKYSGLRSRCPKCGAARVNQPTRVPPTSASATADTAAAERNEMNIRWQYIFAGVLILAVILAVLVLVLSGRSGSSGAPTASVPVNASSSGQASYMAADLPTPSPSPEPTPVATPTPAIESMAISFLNQAVKTDMTLTNAGEIQIDLDVNIFPTQENPQVVWRSSNEKILSVDSTGLVKVVGASPNFTVHATVIAEYGGLQDYVTIYIPAYQSAYLTENLFDPATYEADNLEWDLIIYATPAPKAS